MSFLDSQVKQGAVGNDAGFAIHFHAAPARRELSKPVLAIGSSDYHAQIEVTLEEGFKGGTATLTIEGMIDEHYALIAADGPQKPEIVRLYLFWRDANTSAGAYFSNMLGVNAGPSDAELKESLVAVLKIKKIDRRAGARTYDTVITAQELALAWLSDRRVNEPITAESYSTVLAEVGRKTGVSFVTWGVDRVTGRMTPDRGTAAGDEKVTLGKGLLYRAAVERIAGAIEGALNLYGRHMLLVRDGTVHVGKRPIPLPEGAKPKRLSLATGLLETVPEGEEETDPYASSEVGGTEPKKRPRHRMTLKGRSDIKPGDVVVFDDPTPDLKQTVPGLGTAMVGAFAGPFLPDMGDSFKKEALGYVTSVRHTLSRTAGFVTQLSLLGIDAAGDAAWDTRATSASAPTTDKPSGSSDPAAAAAAQVKRVHATQLEALCTVEVGEVRAVTTSASGAVEPPSQTEMIWEGLVPTDGRANAARRLPIQREQPTAWQSIAYLSPFAWGKCGLVLPRYPGTRVVLAHRNGRADDKLDIGALWESGHGPVSQPGDWWLSLPVIDGAPPSSVGDKETPAEHNGKVSQDLTDAAGNRWIEVGELTIRVGKDALENAGTRPKDPAGARGAITIEHTKGAAKLVIKSDGSIELICKNLTIDAGQDGTITMKARKVDVAVKDAMEVH